MAKSEPKGDDMTGGEALAGKALYEIGKRIAPQGLSWGWGKLTGKDLLFLGPSASGKSCFWEYLRFGILPEQVEHDPTFRQLDKSMFKITLGKDGELKMTFRTTSDTVGHVGPIGHANLFIDHPPHAALIFLDNEKAQSTGTKWVRQFCTRLESVFDEEPKAKKKLRVMMVILNKRDALTEAEFKQRRDAVKKALADNLKNVFTRQFVNRIPILPCISVETDQGSKLADRVIERLAKRLVE